jgi:hypothetical protein
MKGMKLEVLFLTHYRPTFICMPHGLLRSGERLLLEREVWLIVPVGKTIERRGEMADSLDC